jgi:hypothetical protein
VFNNRVSNINQNPDFVRKGESYYNSFDYNCDTNAANSRYRVVNLEELTQYKYI